jgi:hypothetical protein
METVLLCLVCYGAARLVRAVMHSAAENRRNVRLLEYARIKLA